MLNGVGNNRRVAARQCNVGEVMKRLKVNCDKIQMLSTTNVFSLEATIIIK